MLRNGLIAIGIAVAAIVGMLWYGGEQLQSNVWGPQLPYWPMFALWAIGSTAAVLAHVFCTTHAEQ